MLKEQQEKTAKYDGHCKNLSKEEVEANIKAGIPYVIRLRLPENHTIKFTDLVREIWNLILMT